MTMRELKANLRKQMDIYEFKPIVVSAFDTTEREFREIDDDEVALLLNPAMQEAKVNLMFARSNGFRGGSARKSHGRRSRGTRKSHGRRSRGTRKSHGRRSRGTRKSRR
jgi:hypothetical protein